MLDLRLVDGHHDARWTATRICPPIVLPENAQCLSDGLVQTLRGNLRRLDAVRVPAGDSACSDWHRGGGRIAVSCFVRQCEMKCRSDQAKFCALPKAAFSFSIWPLEDCPVTSLGTQTRGLRRFTIGGVRDVEYCPEDFDLMARRLVHGAESMGRSRTWKKRTWSMIMADESLDEYKLYLAEREQLIDAGRESARTFDQAVLAFGSVVFGFSIAFLKDIAPKPAPETLKWLGVSWLLFSLGLLAILLSFLFSHRACMFEIGVSEKAHWVREITYRFSVRLVSR
jgi:hypothetical protein